MREFYFTVIPLLAGFILDMFFGDPRNIPHPIRWFGRAISFFESKFNLGKNRKLKGAFTSILLIIATFLVFYWLIECSQFNIYFYYLVSAIFVFYGLANRSLIIEALKVEEQLSKNGIEAGRKHVSYIVGRDTSQLSENNIRKAVLETLSENLSDGVIAPIFYYIIGGIPLMFAYKMINTLDSMIGYKSNRYKYFGFFAANLDDAVNFFPARITALLMVLVTLSKRGLIFILKYGNKHSSPNAGFPEAALAGILNCQFGGDNFYHGKLVEKPSIGMNDRFITSNDIYKASLINFFVALIFICISVFGIRLIY